MTHNRYIIQMERSIILIKKLTVAWIMYVSCKHTNIMSGYLIFAILYSCKHYVNGTCFMSDLLWANSQIIKFCTVYVIKFVFFHIKFSWSGLRSDYVDSMLESCSFLQSYVVRCLADRIMIELCRSFLIYVFCWSSIFALWLSYDWIMFSSSEWCFSFGSIDLNYDSIIKL